MSPRHACERVLAAALRAPDPVATVARAARDRRHAPATRRALAAASPDGLRVAALLVARLRFERLIRGCREAEEWFERDGAGFGAAFRRYHAEVPPTAFFPPGEARLFLRWRKRAG